MSKLVKAKSSQSKRPSNQARVKASQTRQIKPHPQLRLSLESATNGSLSLTAETLMRLDEPQRQAMVAQIGRLYGNARVQRLIAEVRGSDALYPLKPGQPFVQRRPNFGRTNYRFDTYRITESDLGDAEIKARLSGLSIDGLKQYKLKVTDMAVKAYIGGLLAQKLHQEQKRKGESFRWLRQNWPYKSKEQQAVKARIVKNFTPGTDDVWLAEKIVQHGPEPNWPAAAIKERTEKANKGAGWTNEPVKMTFTRQDTHGKKFTHDVKAYFFQGKSEQRALIIGGVHGSEQAGIQVVEMLIKRLKKGPKPFFTVIIIPILFDRNATRGYKNRYSASKLSTNKARYTDPKECPTDLLMPGGKRCADPNRNFPKLGTQAAGKSPKDELSRTIETPNLILLDLIKRYKPERIASVHSIQSKSSAGFFADPHTDPSGKYGTKEKRISKADWQLAIEMAKKAKMQGAKVQENNILVVKDKTTGKITYDTTKASGSYGGGKFWTKVIPRKNKAKAKPGEFYKPSGKEKGTSLGDWGTQAINGGRGSMTVITVETPQYHRSKDLPGGEKKPSARLKELMAHTIALEEIFLGRP